MLRSFIAFLTMWSVVVISGCNDVPTGGTFVPSGSLGADGVYLSGCYLSTGGGYAITRLTLSGNQFASQNTFYANTDTTCSLSTTASENVGGSYTTFGNNINYNYTGGTTIYDIFQVNGVQFYVGDRTGSLNGSTAAKRPIAYSTGIVFQKI